MTPRQTRASHRQAEADGLAPPRALHHAGDDGETGDGHRWGERSSTSSPSILGLDPLAASSASKGNRRCSAGRRRSGAYFLGPRWSGITPPWKSLRNACITAGSRRSLLVDG